MNALLVYSACIEASTLSVPIRIHHKILCRFFFIPKVIVSVKGKSLAVARTSLPYTLLESETRVSYSAMSFCSYSRLA